MKIIKMQYGDENAPLVDLLRLENIDQASARIGTATFAAGQRIPEVEGMSCHDEDEVSLILEGKLALETEIENVICEAGDLIHLPAGTAHASVALEDSKIYFMLLG